MMMKMCWQCLTVFLYVETTCFLLLDQISSYFGPAIRNPTISASGNSRVDEILGCVLWARTRRSLPETKRKLLLVMSELVFRYEVNCQSMSPRLLSVSSPCSAVGGCQSPAAQMPLPPVWLCLLWATVWLVSAASVQLILSTVIKANFSEEIKELHAHTERNNLCCVLRFYCVMQYVFPTLSLLNSPQQLCEAAAIAPLYRWREWGSERCVYWARTHSHYGRSQAAQQGRPDLTPHSQTLCSMSLPHYPHRSLGLVKIWVLLTLNTNQSPNKTLFWVGRKGTCCDI